MASKVREGGRRHSANPNYPAYTCLVEEAHFVGKVLWTLRKV